MKKIGLIVLLTLSFLLLTNCNKGKNEEVKNEKIKFSKESYDLFEKFATDKKETIEKLKSLNKEEANNLYEEYQAQNNNTLYDIEDAVVEIIEKHGDILAGVVKCDERVHIDAYAKNELGYYDEISEMMS